MHNNQYRSVYTHDCTSLAILDYHDSSEFKNSGITNKQIRHRSQCQYVVDLLIVRFYQAGFSHRVGSLEGFTDYDSLWLCPDQCGSCAMLAMNGQISHGYFNHDISPCAMGFIRSSNTPECASFLNWDKKL